MVMWQLATVPGGRKGPLWGGAVGSCTEMELRERDGAREGAFWPGWWIQAKHFGDCSCYRCRV